MSEAPSVMEEPVIEASLTDLNTLGTPSRAGRLYVVRSLEHAEHLAEIARTDGLHVLGGGSNVVLAERIERPVCWMRIRGLRIERQRAQVEVTAAAGESWHGLVRWSLGIGLSGLENLALIPGSVGAAPVQNIGAYGVELESRFVRLRAIDLENGRIVRLDRGDCAFGYRTSLFRREPGRFVILEVTLALDPTPGEVLTHYGDVAQELDRMGCRYPGPIAVAEAVVRIRRRKLPDPRFVPNAGSFFKNPVVTRDVYETLQAAEGLQAGYPVEEGIKLAAAELIDLCGFKTEQDGPVRVWRRQPLVLTNPGRRPASEVLGYAGRIQAAVADRFDVRLELEPDVFT
jgi:UDP-N-acetylmuramate dehydrogenase